MPKGSDDKGWNKELVVEGYFQDDYGNRERDRARKEREEQKEKDNKKDEQSDGGS